MVQKPNELDTHWVCAVAAVQWHVRDDALNSEQSNVDLAVLRPIWRGGGITYGTAFQGFELPRPETFRLARQKADVRDMIQAKVNGQ